MSRTRRIVLALTGLVLAGAVFLPLPPVPLDVIDTSILLIEDADIFDEDIYVVANTGRIEGLVDGDVVIGVGDLTIDGTVTGDLFVVSQGTLRIGGTVEGSVRGLVRDVEVSGIVGDDLAVIAAGVDVDGSVGRDLLVAGGPVGLGGSVGRDMRGRMLSVDLDGVVGRNVDVTVRQLTVGSGTEVGGDLRYRADNEADIATEAAVRGVTAKLSTRGSFLVRLYLAVANAVGFLLFVLVGFLGLWLFRATSARATAYVFAKPGKTLLTGLVVGVLLPFSLVFAVLLAGSALGAVVVATIVVLLVLVLLALGPVPALAAAGNAITRNRAGLFGGFLVGAVIWRLLAWLLPFGGALVGLLVYVWGVGAWITAGWSDRARTIEAAVFDSESETPAADEVWEPPLPPVSR